MKTTKKRKSKRQKNIENPFSGLWMRKCDRLFGQYFHDNNKIFCVIGLNIKSEQKECLDINRNNRCEMMHLIPKENYLFRWDINNVLPGCSWHHKYSPVISSHFAPISFSIFLQEFYPQYYNFVEENRWNAITRKAELPWTFKEKFQELEQLTRT